MTGKGPTAAERAEAVRVALSGIAHGRDIAELTWDLAALHPKNNTFPGEVLLELAADALGEAGASRDQPVDYEGIRERFLPERQFRGKTDHHKSHYALTAAAMMRAGVQPDLLGEVAWWTNDDLWLFSLYALIIYVRVAAERNGEPVAMVCERIAAQHGVRLAMD